jgi:lipopolysaccharide transport system permease protein
MSERPLLTIRPTTGWAALNVREVWAFRDLIVTLAARDVKLRYRQTYLGIAWVVLQPLLAAGVFSFVFGTVAKLPSDGVPYIVFSYAGLLGWNVFTGTLGKTSHSMLGNSHLISKVYFPRLVLPLSGVVSTLLDAVVSLGPLAVMLAVYGIRPGWGLLLLPVWLVAFVLLGMGLGLVAAALIVSHRDVGYLLPIATQALMYGSPVAYAATAVPGWLQGAYGLNPLAQFLQGLRWSLLGQAVAPPDVLLSGLALALSVAVSVVGAFVFQRMERRFADVI